MNQSNSLSLTAFRAITQFVSDLVNVCPRYKPLKLYNHLISKTNITHDLAIDKHLTAFKNFCENNNEK